MWHNVTTFGQHTRSNDVGRGMPSSPFGSTNGRTTSGVACHHIPWTTNTVEQRWAWHAITAFGQYTRSNDVWHGMPSSLWAAHTVERHRVWHDITVLGQSTQSDYVGCGITSPPLDSTHNRTTLDVACHHRLLAAQTVERRRAWHAIIALGRQTRSDDVRRYMPSPPLDSTHSRTTSGVV